MSFLCENFNNVLQGDDGLTGEMGPPGPTGHPVSYNSYFSFSDYTVVNFLGVDWIVTVWFACGLSVSKLKVF